MPGPGTRFSGWLGALPHRAHLIPYGALLALGAVLLAPGVVPHGPGCSGELSTATAADRELFIHASAAAFGLIAALLLLSALAASAQRRGGRPGLPTIATTSVLAALTLATVIWPHAPIAAPALVLMSIDLVAFVLSYGVAFALILVIAAIFWRALTGPRRPRVAQIGAWGILLVALPLAMAATYLTVTPICFN